MKKIICFVILLASFVLPQQVDTTDFFPLQVGDKWWRLSVYNRLDSLEITKTENINDTLYYVTNKGDYFRKDTAGNVYKRIDNKDQLYFNFTAKEGDSWFIDTGIVQYKVTLVNDSADGFDAAIGKFSDAKIFQISPVGQDSNNTTGLILAPGVGLIARQFSWGLRRAIINGLVISKPFQYLSFDPLRGETNVSIATKIKFSFLTIIDTNIIGQYINVKSRKNGDVNGNIYYDNSLENFVFTPSHYLLPNDTITITISANLKDIWGEGFDGNKDWIYEGSPADDISWKLYTVVRPPNAPEVWSKPQKITSFNLSGYYADNPSVSPDGKKIFWITAEPPNPTSIYFSEKTDTGWTKPKKLNNNINTAHLKKRRQYRLMVKNSTSGNMIAEATEIGIYGLVIGRTV